MFGSKNTYFHQNPFVLRRLRHGVCRLLSLKGYTVEQCNVYMKAFDYFVQNPDIFDGATLVKDLQDMPDIDLDAMLHDYHYVVYNAGANFKTKWKADWMYAKGNERKGKGQYSAFSRLIGLIIIGIGFVPWAYCTRGKITLQQKQELIKDYKTLLP
jgi:hypothetical protein